MTRTHVTALVSTQDCGLHELSTQLDAVVWESKDTIYAEPGSMLLWIAGDYTEAIDDALTNDSSVGTHTLMTDGAERRLYRLNWAEAAGIMTLIDTLQDHEGELRSASGRSDAEWTLDFVTPDREDLSAVCETCTAHGIQLELAAICDFDSDRDERAPVTLTGPQYEALQAAYEHGYFEIPRETKLEKLASNLGVSHQSLSEVLRRAQHDLLDQTIFTDPLDNENEQKEAVSPLESVQ